MEEEIRKEKLKKEVQEQEEARKFKAQPLPSGSPDVGYFINYIKSFYILEDNFYIIMFIYIYIYIIKESFLNCLKFMFPLFIYSHFCVL